MTDERKRFQHSSVQDADSVVELIQAIAEGLNKGRLTLGDDAATVNLKPRGLLEINIDAEQQSGVNNLNLQIRWTDAQRKISKKTLRIR